MLTLSNSELSIEILDPGVETARLGSRYCSGGYIWQVNDARLGALLSGPEYPNEPTPFNGQGIPDMFRRPLADESTGIGEEVSPIGVGRVLKSGPKPTFSAADNTQVNEHLVWQVERHPNRLVMTSEHHFGRWAYAIERSVALSGRAVRSSTVLTCRGELPLSLYWFPHPFFPLTRDERLCRFSIPVRLPDNPGFVLDKEGFILRKPGHDWKKGCFVSLEFDSGADSLTITQKHDLLGEVNAWMGYRPAYLPIWGNQRTFSFEPYIEREIAPGQSTEWEMEYRF